MWSKPISRYAPLASITKLSGGPVDAVVETVAVSHGKTNAQVLLRWSIQTGKLPLTTTSKPERLIEYLDVLEDGFELSDKEVTEISAAGNHSPKRLYWINCKGQFHEDPTKELHD
jgi:diketogulonate reductase-like aldo/keto reductase